MRLLPAVALLLVLFAPPATAQRAAAGPKSAPRPRATQVERFRRMPPAQRSKALADLPPERRAQMEQRLQRLDAMSPAERRALEKRYEAFQKLPPEKQDRARNMFREFNGLPEDRRAEVQSQMDSLRLMTAADRSALLASSGFQRRFDGREREILNQFHRFLGDTQE